jgi:hypothetical protein
MTVYILVTKHKHISLNREDGGSIFLRNVGIVSHYYKASQPRRPRLVLPSSVSLVHITDYFIFGVCLMINWLAPYFGTVLGTCGYAHQIIYNTLANCYFHSYVAGKPWLQSKPAFVEQNVSFSHSVSNNISAICRSLVEFWFISF